MKKQRMESKFIGIVSLLTLSVPTLGWAMGKPAPVTPTPTPTLPGPVVLPSQTPLPVVSNPVASPTTAPACKPPAWNGGIANPKRSVRIASVGTRSFKLPNGVEVNLGEYFNEILKTYVGSTGLLEPEFIDPTSPATHCDEYSLLEAKVSTIDLSSYDFSIQFGYTPNSTSEFPIRDLNGTIDFKVGNIQMEFHVYNCKNGVCSAPVNKSANAVTTGINLGLSLDFGMIKVGPQFTALPQVDNALRSIMTNGLDQVIKDPNLSSLHWQANVLGVDPSIGKGEIYIDVGHNKNIRVGDAFEVDAANSNTGVCNTFRTLGYVHIIRVDQESSVALLDDQVIGAREIQSGDVVKIRSAPR